jgi:hypothetical protein
MLRLTQLAALLPWLGRSLFDERGFLAPFGSMAIAKLTWSGAASGSAIMLPGTVVNFASTTGTYTITVTNRAVLTFIGIAAGGSGGYGLDPNYGGGNFGGAGGGAGAYTAGTVVDLRPGKTYTLVVPSVASNSSNGSALTFTNTTDSVTLVSLGGGSKGADAVGASNIGGGVGGIAATGSNLHNGASGGNAGQFINTNGTNDTNGAGGGAGGNDRNAYCSGFAGGAGKDESGAAGVAGNGGHGGGMDIGGTKCGGGGGGGWGASHTQVYGGGQEQGGCKFAA